MKLPKPMPYKNREIQFDISQVGYLLGETEQAYLRCSFQDPEQILFKQWYYDPRIGRPNIQMQTVPITAKKEVVDANGDKDYKSHIILTEAGLEPSEAIESRDHPNAIQLYRTIINFCEMENAKVSRKEEDLVCNE